MKNTFSLKFFTIPVILFFFAVPSYAQDTAGGHRGGITALIHKGNEVISSGDDGFIVIWDINQRISSRRFQLTTDKIETIVSHPQNDNICIVEAGGPNNYRISAWNYTLKQKLFSVHSTEPVTYINYSARGSFIIAAGLNGRQLTLLDSETGRIIGIPDIPSGSIAFAATGRTERNMLLYQAEHENDLLFEPSFNRSLRGGQILYLDLDSGSVTSHFRAPGNLLNPVIFGNNSFIAGINSGGLLLVDAISGAIFDSIENIGRDALLYSSNNELYCLSRKGTETILYRFSVGTDRKFVIQHEMPLSFDTGMGIVTSFAFNGSAVFAASTQGNLLLLGPQNTILPMAHNFQTRITEIAAGQNSIAILTEDGDFSFIPLNYRLLERTANITLVKKEGYTRIISLPPAEDTRSGKDQLIDQPTDQFILWQSANTRYNAQIVASDKPDVFTFSSAGRFPLRAISSLNNRLLFLDTAGNLSLYNSQNISARADFTSSSPGAVDAAFINSEYLILCRNAINNNSPFLYINFRTGETVPVSYGVEAALTVTAVESGKVYAETIERDGDRFITAVIELSPALIKNTRTGYPARIFEYQGEAAYFSIAESAGRTAITCGSEGAFLIMNETTDRQKIYFERTSALPVKLLGCDGFFISLDSEGNIAWHDNKNGKVLAVFSLYADQWILQNARKTSGRLLRQQTR
ncbi:MAG: hypothetical protein LBQ93_01275 [Treponema sp.]|jgi:WD40 repeat protein|nr:hypothetical protein [Treponema sp.]